MVEYEVFFFELCEETMFNKILFCIIFEDIIDKYECLGFFKLYVFENYFFKKC